MKLKNVVVYTGYVESNSWSALCLQHQGEGFDSVERMLQNLGACILTGYRVMLKHSYFPKCCIDSMEKVLNTCATCGKDLVRIIDRTSLSIQIRDLRRGHNDTNPNEIWEILASNNWMMWNDDTLKETDFTNVVILKERGEALLADAAFGRVFMPALLDKSDYDYCHILARRAEPVDKLKKEFQHQISFPKGAKLFVDD